MKRIMKNSKKKKVLNATPTRVYRTSKFVWQFAFNPKNNDNSTQ